MDTTTAIFGNSLIENTVANAALCLGLAQSGHWQPKFAVMHNTTYLLSSSRRLIRNKKITIETEEKLSLLVQFGEFSKPVRLFPGYAFAPDREGRHDRQ